MYLGLHWTLHLTFLRFHILKQGKSGVKRVQRNSIYNINIIYTISLTPTTIHFQKRKDGKRVRDASIYASKKYRSSFYS